MRRGKFISCEGMDGSGKTTHIQWLAEELKNAGIDLVSTREPGGTPLGEKLRILLLHEPMTHDSEALLMFAARREHLEQVIRPALDKGQWVVCDRFTDSSFAYQAGGHGVSVQRLNELERWIHPDLQPDLTLLFDVPPAVSRARLDSQASSGRGADKFEREQTEFFARVRDAYLARAHADPGRFRIINSAQPLADVRADVAHCLQEMLQFLEPEAAVSPGIRRYGP